MPGTSAIGGLISGIDTTDLIDQLLAVSRKRIDVVVDQQEKKETKLASFQSVNTQLADFQSQAEALKDSDTFNVFKTSSSTTSTSYTADQLVTASATEEAVPGTHTISFTSTSKLAQARQLSSASFSSSSTALSISGDFIINGKAISVTTSDTLADIVSSINTANSGSDATGVTATLISVSDTDNRMVLTSDKTGEDMFSILDASLDTENILQSLGLTDSATATIKNATSDGAESDGFSDSNTAVGSLLGMSATLSKTVTIGGDKDVDIDLSSESLSTIADNINTALAGAGTATVESRITDGATTYYIDISGTTEFSDTDNVLQALGILEGQQSEVAEEHTASKVNTTDGASAEITITDTFADIFGASSVTGDTITFTGTKHDGSQVTEPDFSINTSVAFNDTGGLLETIESAFGLTAGSATITDGQIVITDDQTGDSQLSVNIITNNENGGTLDFGTVSVTQQGYEMETTAGQDAKVTIDGVTVTRSSNTIDDVISGVTLDLSRLGEDLSKVDLVISRDTDSIKTSINSFTDAYNSIIEFINQEFTFDEDSESSGVLSGESTLSTIKSIIQSTITSTIKLLPSGSNALSLIGITSDVNGKISLNDSDFMSAINSDFYAVKRLFVAEGTTTNNEITYLRHSKDTVAGEYDITINTVATQASITGTVDLTSGIGSGNTETLTITDTSSNRVATITLDGDTSQNGSSIDNIVNTINSELATDRIQTLVGDVANTASAEAITSATKFDTIDGNTLDNDDDNVISFTGANRAGASINGSYTISDVSTDTVQGFLTAIETAYENTVSATINSTGNIVLTDDIIGNSSLSISITEPGSLDFGTVLTSNTGGITGRYAMEITATDNGSGNLVLTHDSYGSANSFTTVETNDRLGTEGTYTGVDVAGTINGESATGTGQLLLGDAPPDSSSTTSIEDLAIRVTSTTTSAEDPDGKGFVKVTMGVAELMYNNMTTITDQIDGLLTIRMDGLQDTIDGKQKTILAMEDRLLKEEARLNYQFLQLELNLSKLQSVSSFLATQLGQLSKSN